MVQAFENRSKLICLGSLGYGRALLNAGRPSSNSGLARESPEDGFACRKQGQGAHLQTRMYYTARVTRYNELHGCCNTLHSSLHECRYMAQKTLVRKNGLVRPLVTMSSNGAVRKLVTRSLSELIETPVGG